MSFADMPIPEGYKRGPPEGPRPPVPPPPPPVVGSPAWQARALDVQHGGAHYKSLKIQPFEYCHSNAIPFAEGCVIKYVTRWKSKGGVEDLKKARHFLDLLIEAESK